MAAVVPYSQAQGSGLLRLTAPSLVPQVMPMWDDKCVVQLLRHTDGTAAADAPRVAVSVEAMDDPSFPCSVATVALSGSAQGQW